MRKLSETKINVLESESCAKQNKKTLFFTLFLIFVGGIVGLINGLLGGGGGMICVPTLENVLRLERKKAHATAIAVIFPISLISAYVYVLSGALQTLPMLTIGFGAAFGGILGAYLLKFLPEKVVGMLFSLLMIVAGVRMLL